MDFNLYIVTQFAVRVDIVIQPMKTLLLFFVLVAYASIESADEPVHQRSLIRAFAARKVGGGSDFILGI